MTTEHTDDRLEGFAQIPRWLQRAEEVSWAAKLVYLALSSRVDKYGQAHPSHKLLAKECSCSVPAVKRALVELRDLGVLDWSARTRDNDEGRTSNVYTLRLGARPPRSVRATPQAQETYPLALTDLPPSSHRPNKNESQINESQKNEELTLIGADEDEVTPESGATSQGATAGIRLYDDPDDSSEPTPTPDQLFEAFWSVWPRKVDKKDARAAFVKILTARVRSGRSEADAATWIHIVVIAAARRWAHQWQTVEQRQLTRIPHAATWLNAERWDDEIPDDPPPGVSSQAPRLNGRRMTNAEQALADYQNRYQQQGETDGTATGPRALDPGLSDRQPHRL